MRPLLLALAAMLAFVLAACPSVAIRDAKVYQTEIKFFEQANMQQADALEHWVKANCCDAGAFKADETCKKSAKLIQVVRARIPYHRDMMNYLGGITEKRPPKDPPKVPPVDDLCKEGS
jgi:hypothetical protein